MRIAIKGTKYLDKNTLISISGLNIGENISVPGEVISNAIRKLWKQGLFSDISVNITRIEGKEIYLEIHLKEHGKLSKFKFEGNIKRVPSSCFPTCILQLLISPKILV